MQIGSTLSFSVKSYDDVCYTAENPASSSSVQVKINGRYNVRLISESGTQICLVDDNTALELAARITPSQSSSLILGYTWYKNGVQFATSTDSVLKISNALYPGILVIGETARFGVTS